MADQAEKLAPSMVPPSASGHRPGAASFGRSPIDWRTLDPALIQRDGAPIEELLTYREKIEELLERAEGKYVLISGREVVAFYDDLESAGKGAEEHRGKGRILVKKIAAIEPVHTLGGAVV